MDWSKIKKVYLIGIKGQGLTTLAQFLSASGKVISGSDVAESWSTELALKRIKAEIKIGFSAEHLPADADLIIYSTAYNQDNSEVAAALTGPIKTLTYAEALADIFNQSFGIAVTGSHGKSTTTAWLGFVLERAGLSPSVMVGATVPQFSGQGLAGKSNYLVIEADEYQNKLAGLEPKLILLNNIDYDHPDFFPTAADYQRVFAEFVAKLPAKGRLVANYDDAVVKQTAAEHCRGKIISYALKNEADYRARDITYQQGQQYFKVEMNGEDLGNFNIALAGEHNVANALAVIAAALELEVDLLALRTHLAEFTGVARRLEKLGEFNGALIIDDYAHHPTEIKAALAAARQLYPDNKLTVVFHPHTFSRTKVLFNDFVNCFSGVDQLIVLDIYGSARETPHGVSAAELVKKMRLVYKDKLIMYLPTLQQAADYLRHNAQAKEVIILMGAGDVFRIGQQLVES